MNEWQMRGKDSSPAETIAKVESILASLGLKTRLTDFEPDVENCYSCRLAIEGPLVNAIGTNGKGMTRELCHASAYGEMMERLSNRIFMAMPRMDDPRCVDFVSDEQRLYDVKDENQPAVLKDILDRIVASVKIDHPFLSKDCIVNTLMERLGPTALKGKYMAHRYYDVFHDDYVYLPDWLMFFTGSNGMAAGNTLEEAIVEGLSEVVERYAQMRIFDGDVIPPEIPMDYIRRYPHIAAVIENIEAKGAYKVRVLDCSLGIGLPVVCGLIINQKTGKFGVKFGAQPHMAIALERIFTESMQGANLEEFTARSNPDYVMYTDNRRRDKWNSIKISSSNMPAQLLMKKESYPFVPWGETPGQSNREVLQGMMDQLKAMDVDVYIRDASYLDFPAVNIFVSRMSETLPVDFLELQQRDLSNRVSDYFTRIDQLTDEEVKEMALLASMRQGAVLDCTLNAMSQLMFEKPSFFEPFDAFLLEVACRYRLKDFAGAAGRMEVIVNNASYLRKPEEGSLARAMLVWLNGMAAGTDPEEITAVVSLLYPTVVDQVKTMLEDPDKVLEKIYPVVREKSIEGLKEAGSLYNEVFNFYKLLFDAEKNNPVDPENIRRVFQA
ncbi:MAG: YcaO-like family protein [Lachnospiraceae bacterium]|nr:YcaO-like family protein [Lachnospiraceae bacterium]